MPFKVTAFSVKFSKIVHHFAFSSICVSVLQVYTFVELYSLSIFFKGTYMNAGCQIGTPYSYITLYLYVCQLTERATKIHVNEDCKLTRKWNSFNVIKNILTRPGKFACNRTAQLSLTKMNRDCIRNAIKTIPTQHK